MDRLRIASLIDFGCFPPPDSLYSAIMIQAFHGWVDPQMAKQLVALPAPHKLLFTEEPLLRRHVAEIVRLAQQTATLIALFLNKTLLISYTPT